MKHDIKAIEKHRLDEIRSAISKGCDERIFLNKDGQIKYGLNLMEYDTVIHRGSCTCGSLNDANVSKMLDILENVNEIPVNYSNLLDEQTRHLKSMINYEGEDAFEVFYAPSGSDLVYYPIVFNEILHPQQPILNILSCPEELGSGTLLAVQGRYHADYNQFDEPVSKGGIINNEYKIKVLPLSARGLNGKIINHQTYIKEQINAYPNHSKIISLVYGSKSGIEDNLELLDTINHGDITWCIDMCQFRHSKDIIHRLLKKNGCVMITGSKFYQAPPFCGALLVSKPYMKQLKRGDLSQFKQFEKVFSAYDLPVSIQKKSGLDFKTNISTRLRWACALEEMEKFKAIPKAIARKKIKDWNQFVINELKQNNTFELMPDQSMTNKTIISFRVRSNGRYLDHEELKRLYQIIVKDGRLSVFDYKKVFIGQPVAYGKRSFLRLAIGSMNIRRFLENNDTAFNEDREIIKLIAENANSFENIRS